MSHDLRAYALGRVQRIVAERKLTVVLRSGVGERTVHALEVAGDLIRKAKKAWDPWRRETLFGGVQGVGDVTDLRRSTGPISAVVGSTARSGGSHGGGSRGRGSAPRGRRTWDPRPEVRS